MSNPTPTAHTPLERELMEALEGIAREAKIANDAIALGRANNGSGRVKVATAMHRIVRLSEAAISLARAAS